MITLYDNNFVLYHGCVVILKMMRYKTRWGKHLRPKFSDYQVRAEEAFITQRSGSLAEAAGEVLLVFKQQPQP